MRNGQLFPHIAFWAPTRRSLLMSIAAMGFVRRTTAASPDLTSSKLESTLRAFSDVIVPPDEAPSAGELEVHRAILREAPGRMNYPELLIQGAGWLDERATGHAGTGFAAAPEAMRVRVVEEAFAAAHGTLPRVFAEFIRQDVMRLYYARPESWAGMIDGPPQPAGFLLAHLPPDPLR